MLVFVAIFVVGTIAILKTKFSLDNLTKIVTAISITLILITMPNFVYGGVSTSELYDDSQFVDNVHFEESINTYELKNLSLLDSQNKPDIYYILLDGYGGTKRMKQDLNFDNYYFLSELNERGFSTSDSSTGNYPSTKWHTTALLNMNYLPAKEIEQSDQEYYSTIFDMFHTNETMRNFHHLDYKIISLQRDGTVKSEFLYNDQIFCLDEELNQSRFTQMLLRTTILNYFNNQLVINVYRDTVLCGFSEISQFTLENEKPVFVYMHLAIPHPPYVFGPNGEFVFGSKAQTEEGSFVDEKRYVDSIIFVNKKVLETVDEILQNNENSIIIVQSDHGYDFGIDYENPSELSLKQRFSTLNAIYLPDKNPEILYDQKTPVNTFRIIFNEYFGATYPILEDRMYYHPYGVNYVHKDPKFEDVTEIILN